MSAPELVPPPELLAEARAGLSAKELKKLRERARRIVERETVEAETSRIREAKGTAAQPAVAEVLAPTDAPSPPAPAPDPGRSDDDRAADAAAFLSGVLFPVLAVLARWFSPWLLDLESFTDAQAVEDGRAWVGVMRRYVWVDRLVAWSAPFARLIRRLRVIARDKGKA